MKTIALHSTEYLKAHASDERICLTTFSKKIGRIIDHITTSAVTILLVTLVTVACIKVGQSAVVGALYCDASTKVVLVP
ncbi:MAG: hypothetical protein ACYTFM_10030 [Planctomycetota bacterium]|jgi:hypothetical protein